MDVQSSDINFLLEKVKKRNYRKFLIGLRMHSVRSFTNQYIEFKFPITAVIGTNGGGKSTILGSAALAYKSVKPGDFFPKSNISDNSMANWKIEYDLIDRSNNKEEFQTNARFVSARWRREKAPEREVIVIPIQRTVPANEIAKFKKFIGTTQLLDIDTIDIDTSVIRIVSRILSKDVSGYKRIFLKNDSSKSILTGIKRHNDYSQFHFGAGEASIIEMVTKLEGAQEEALVLIEEIENGLHPLATEKMVEYLFDVAKRKKCQVIFMTHSENAISKLPSEGIWACIDGRAYNGKLSIESLRALTGSVEKNKVIFVEDEFAKDFCEELLRQYASEVMEQIEVHKAGGYPHVVKVMKFHNQDPSNKSEAIALIDGDVQSGCNIKILFVFQIIHQNNLFLGGFARMLIAYRR
ncbi:MAG: AAA family ATPase [Halobacteriota archaeon]